MPSGFHPIVSRWFLESIGEPTSAQRRGWDAIRAGRHTLIAAPTGSGKTLAAFLTAIDDLVREGSASSGPAAFDSAQAREAGHYAGHESPATAGPLVRDIADVLIIETFRMTELVVVSRADESTLA